MRRITSAGAGVGLVLSMLLCTPVALASTTPRVSATPLEGHLRRGLGTSNSTNWSGYASYGVGFTSAQGSWVQPKVNCEPPGKHSYALAAFWVGLDGYEDNTVEQTGSEADCGRSAPVYYAWWELYPKSSVLIREPVTPGDQMHAEVTQDELVLEDSTAKWTFSRSFLPGSLAFSSAEWIAEAPAKNAISDFGSVHFSAAAASSEALTGGPIESQSWSDDAITLVSGSPQHPTLLATPGSLEEGGRAFTIQQVEAGSVHGHSHG